MLFIYRTAVNILYPIIILFIYSRIWIKKEDKKRYKEKLFSSSFAVRKSDKKKLIWFHVASIGEFNSIRPIIHKLHKDNKFNFLITSITFSSAKLVEDEFLHDNRVAHRYLPIDKSSLAKKFLNSWSPNLAIFVDSEIWPNFIFEIKKNNIPLLLLNARITQKTFLKWNLIKKTARKIFNNFDLFLVSSKESKLYLEKLGQKNIKYFGNIKMTIKNNKNNLDHNNKNFLSQNKFWCALSTHAEESNFCLRTHYKIKKIHNDVITIIIPRHIEDSNKIALNSKKLNLSCQILNINDLIKKESEIIIINSYGEIPKYLEFCNSVFVGKSLLKKKELVGGQNPIEAAKFGCKIYHGPYVRNFEEVYSLFNEYKISEKIYTEDELSNKLVIDLNSSEKTKDNVISKINDLGDKILNNTYKEINKIIN